MEDDDDVDHFCKSLALSIKKLPSKGISEAKMKMLLALTELKEKYSAPTLNANNPST